MNGMRSFFPVAALLVEGACAALPVTPQVQLGPFKRPETRGQIGPFQSVDGAAIAVCAWLGANIPDVNRHEYAGCIYRSGGGIWAGLPETIGEAKWCMIPLEPAGAVVMGDYHSHPTRETFGEMDLLTREVTPKYLCNPRGEVWRFSPDDQTVVRLQ